MRLRWVLRDILGLTGTKFGRGMSRALDCVAASGADMAG